MNENNAKMPKSDKVAFWSSSSDGKMTIGDVIVNLATILLFTMLGALLATGAWIAGVDWVNARRFMFYAVGIGGGIVTFRIILDMLNLAGIIESFRNRKIVRLATEPVHETSPNPLRPIPVYTAASRPEPAVELPNGAKVSYALLSDYLLTAVQFGGTAWSRELWCNRPDAKSKPGKGKMRPIEWAGIRQLCQTMDIWRTGDQKTVNDFLEKMKGETE